MLYAVMFKQTLDGRIPQAGIFSNGMVLKYAKRAWQDFVAENHVVRDK